jgi:phosphoesterase family protein
MSHYVRLLACVVVFSSILGSIGYANLSNVESQPHSQPTLIAQSPVGGAYFDHLVIIMMENEGIYDICQSNPPPCDGSNAPYMSGLANSYGIGDQYLSLIGTSWPDYYGILGASIYGCPSNCYPATGSITATNLVDRFEAAGISWRSYMEDQNVAAGCDTGTHGAYEYDHNGFVAFQDITTNTARCNNIVLANPSSCNVTDCAMINDLNSNTAPNFMWLTPNDCNDMKAASGCSNGCTSAESNTCISDGDKYLGSLVPNILNSNAFKTTRSALFITFDEGNGYCPLNGGSEDCLYTVWAGPVAKTSFSSTTKYNHYSLTKTIETNWNLQSLTNNDAGSSAMTEFLKTTTQSPDFAISASPSSLTATSGSSATSTITVASLNGFTATVNLSASSSPVGPSVSISPSSVTLSSGTSAASTLTVSTQSSTPSGTYTIILNGSSGSLSHSTTISLTVSSGTSTGDFSISANPSSVSLIRGSSATSKITLTSLSGFSGTIQLSTSTSSGSLKASLSSSSIVLTSGGSGTSSLTLRTGHKTPIGTYEVTLTGTCGSLSHSITITVQVMA